MSTDPTDLLAELPISADELDFALLQTTYSVDIPLLRKTLDWATDEHRKSQRGETSEWRQDVWFCGTACCIAGKVALETGWEPVPLAWEKGAKVRRNGEVFTTPAVAAAALGLPPAQARALFHEKNTIRSLWNLAQLFTAGEITAPPELDELLDEPAA